MPINVDNIVFTRTTDPDSPVDGQAWYNSTDDKFKKRRNGVTEIAAMKVDVVKELMISAGTPVSRKTTSYSKVADFVLDGSIPPTAIKVILSKEAEVTTIYARVFDETNSLQIAEASTTADGPVILDLGTLSNLPTSDASISVEIKGNVSNKFVYWHALSVYH